jgi:hypothetical protein
MLTPGGVAFLPERENVYTKLMIQDTFKQNEIDLIGNLLALNEQISNSYSHSFYYTSFKQWAKAFSGNTRKKL